MLLSEGWSTFTAMNKRSEVTGTARRGPSGSERLHLILHFLWTGPPKHELALNTAGRALVRAVVWSIVFTSCILWTIAIATVVVW